MAKGKIKTDIKHNNYIFIDGQTGKRMTEQQYLKRYGTPMPEKFKPKV
jgi:hypothetical protein